MMDQIISIFSLLQSSPSLHQLNIWVRMMNHNDNLAKVIEELIDVVLFLLQASLDVSTNMKVQKYLEEGGHMN